MDELPNKWSDSLKCLKCTFVLFFLSILFFIIQILIRPPSEILIAIFIISLMAAFGGLILTFILFISTLIFPRYKCNPFKFMPITNNQRNGFIIFLIFSFYIMGFLQLMNQIPESIYQGRYYWLMKAIYHWAGNFGLVLFWWLPATHLVYVFFKKFNGKSDLNNYRR